MSIEIRIGGTLRNNRVSVPDDISGFVDAAERGAYGSGGCIIENPAGDLVIDGWQTFTVDDTLATPTRVFTGYIFDRGMGRGNFKNPAAAGVLDCTVVDLNALLHTKLVRYIDNDGKRPAESDVARTAWLLGSRAMAGVIYDEGLVSTANPINFLAEDLRRKYADDILNSYISVAGKNFYVYHDTSSGHPALAYQRDPDAYWAAGISISNDHADESSTCFYPLIDAVVSRSPEAQYTGVDYMAKGVLNVWAESADTIADIGLRRESVYDTDRVGHLSTAQSEAVRYLNVHAHENDTVVVTLELPSASVNLAYAGQEIVAKFSHIDGYETGVTCRIRRRDARPILRGTETRWRVRYELWVPGAPGSDAATPACAEPPIQSFSTGIRLGANLPAGETFDFSSAPTAGNTMVAVFYGAGNGTIEPSGGSGGWPAGWTQDFYSGAILPGGPYSMQIEVRHKAVVGGDTGLDIVTAASITNTYIVHMLEFTGNVPVIQVVHAYSSSTVITVPGITTAGDSLLLGVHERVTSATPRNTPVGWTDELIEWEDLGDRQLVETAWQVFPAGTLGSSTFIGGVEAADIAAFVILQLGNCSDPLPATGSIVGPETAGGVTDGSNTDFTTAGPFIAGSLRVLHDGFDQTDHVVTQDPEAGTFSLDYAPSAGSTIIAYYQAG